MWHLSRHGVYTELCKTLPARELIFQLSTLAIPAVVRYRAVSKADLPFLRREENGLIDFPFRRVVPFPAQMSSA